MSNSSANTSTFIEQAEAIILKNLANEQFGVSELADAMNMSRSNLLRKIKKQTKLSASQFIRQIRLKEAMELLKEGSLTVSEISFKLALVVLRTLLNAFGNSMDTLPEKLEKVLWR